MILQSADELFKNRKLTFEDLHKLNYKHFNNGKEKQEDQFRPSDIIDMNDKEDNDVLRKFKQNPSRFSNKKAPPQVSNRAAIQQQSSEFYGLPIKQSMNP